MVDPYQPPIADLGGAGGPVAGGEYEFGSQENLTIERTAKLAKIWGIMALVTGVLFLVMMLGTVALLAAAMSAASAATGSNDLAVFGMIIAMSVAAFGPLALAHLVTGWYYVRSGQSFREIVDSSGHDVDLLLTGLTRVTGAFKVEVIFVVISAVLSGAIYVAAQFMDAMQRSGG